MRKVMYIVILFVFLQGCKTTEGYKQVVASWVGSDINELIKSWGPPDSVFKLPNNDIMYTWLSDGGSVAMPIGNIFYAVRKSCKTTFTTNEQGIITTWSFKGNTCKQ